MKKAIIHASQLLSGVGVAQKDGRHPKEQDLGQIDDAAIVYGDKHVHWVGKTSELPKKFLKVPRKNLRLKLAVIPGLVDCHTHLIFAGDRSEEFAARCGGATYEEIAKKGGGIITTVKATRAASVDELVKLAIPRAEEAYSFGVRTLEIKSGYGLSVEAELNILKAAKILKARFPKLTFSTTFLGAHAFPPEVSRKDYLDQITNQMLPEVARKKLADACDVFIDEGYYTCAEGRTILEKAKKLGLKIKIHADELVNTESSSLAVDLGALSADHLLKISDKSIKKLAKSNTVAVLLPGTAFYLKAPYAPARKLIDAGAAVALSTDFNPGTCMTLSLPVIMTISALYMGMTKAEIFAAVTYNGAKALGLSDQKGTLEVGKSSDFAVLPFERFEEMYYRFAWSPLLTR